MEDALQFEWSALEKLLPLCIKFAKQKHQEGEIGLHEAVKEIGNVFGIEDVDKFAVDQLRNALEKGLGQSLGEEEALAIATVFAKNFKPVMKLIVQFAKGENDSVQLITGLNSIHFGSIDELQTVLQKALGVPDPMADALAGQFGAYLVSVYCFAAAFKIYKDAARDAKIAKEHRIEVERLSEKAVAHLKNERAHMSELVCAYLLDRLLPFNEGLVAMDQAILDDDDDGYIRANSELWKTFGRKPQYTNSSEFEDLMLSDEAFKL